MICDARCDERSCLRYKFCLFIRAYHVELCTRRPCASLVCTKRAESWSCHAGMGCCMKRRACLVGDAEDVSGDVSHADAHEDCKLHYVPRLPRLHPGCLHRGGATTAPESTPVRPVKSNRLRPCSKSCLALLLHTLVTAPNFSADSSEMPSGQQ